MTDFSTQEFIRDFLDESAEHLQNIHHNLLALEETLRSEAVETAVTRVALVNELFRSYHTLKGLAGMVGLAQAEELSHALESVLRAVQNMQVEVEPEVIDRLLHGTRTLEAIIATVGEQGANLPEIREDLAALEALFSKNAKPGPKGGSHMLPGPGEGATLAQSAAGIAIPHPEVAAGLSPLEQQQLQAARAAGQSLTLAIFTPDSEKAARGTNINSLRQELRQAGELIKSLPLIQGNAIRFAFLIASPEPLNPANFPEMEWVSLDPAEGGALPEAKQPDAPVGSNGTAAQAPQMAGQPASAHLAASSAVRVELERLDELMRLVSDLVVTRYHLHEIVPALQGALPTALDALEQTLGELGRSLRDLSQAVVRARMVPLAEVFGHMPLAVRDLARASGKEVRLIMEGEGTEVDKLLVERLLDPLLHLVRNAITHGIETPDERRAAGKPPQGTLTLCGAPQGDRIRISVSDDGRGLDAESVAAKAASLGWLEPGRTAPLTEVELLDLICHPGFSTKSEADLGAGRGIGMDVVRRMVDSAGGRLDLDTAPGKGTTFSLYLPLTLTIVDALVVRSGGERFAIPRSSVDRVIEIDPEKIVRIESGELYPYREDSLNLVRLADLFHLPTVQSGPFLSGLISVEGDRRTVLVVDRLLGLREAVVRTIADPLVARPGISGATELGDGKVILILDLKNLFQSARQVR